MKGAALHRYLACDLQLHRCRGYVPLESHRNSYLL